MHHDAASPRMLHEKSRDRCGRGWFGFWLCTGGQRPASLNDSSILLEDCVQLSFVSCPIS